VALASTTDAESTAIASNHPSIVITLTLPTHQLHAIRELIAAKKSASMSCFVQHVVNIALSEAVGLGTMLDDALLQTGGALTEAECEWAD